MSAENAQYDNEEVAQRLKGLSFSERQPRITRAHWRYRERVAVRMVYLLTELQPAQDRTTPAEQQAIQQVLGESTLTQDEQQPGWRLDNTIRRRTLQRLAQSGRLREVLEANPASYRSPVQDLFDDAVRGQLPAPSEMKLEQLEAYLRVVRWLEGCVLDLPAEEEVHRWLARGRLLKPFRFLVGDHFRNRTKELSRMRRYVGVLAPEDGDPDAHDPDEDQQTPLLVYGPGGIGKSTLISKFILEHADLNDAQRIPFAYIDFNRRDLDIREPISILLEATRQLAIQYPDQRDAWRELWQDLRSAQEKYAAGQGDRGYAQSKASVSYQSRAWQRAVRFQAETLRELLPDDRPLLLVLDTIEELLYYYYEYLSELWDFLHELMLWLPNTRLLLSGRTTLPERFPTNAYRLPELAADDAVKLLQKQGVPDEETARKVVEFVGRSPFAIWLAARLYLRMQKEGRTFDGLEERQEYYYHVKEYLLQGQLYQRFLGHIHDERVRKLAHPGMVLRRVTAELILEVLAGPSGVDVADIDDARNLFEQLRQETAFVEIDETDADELRQRPELRLAMLELIMQDDLDMVDQIHRAAIQYYRRRIAAGEAAGRPVDIRDQADLVYHRLAREEEPSFLDDYPRDELQGIAQELRSAIVDLPAVAQTYLVTRTGLDVHLEEDVWAKAKQLPWEQETARAVTNLLNLGRYEQALAQLSARSERTRGSRLYPLHVLALTRLKRYEEAEVVLAEGVRRTPPRSRPMQALQLLAADLYEEQAKLDAALAANRRALRIAQRREAAGASLRIQLNIMRLCRVVRSPEEAEQEYLLLLLAWEAVDDRQLVAEPGLVREVAAQVGSQSEAVIKRAVRLVGLGYEPPIEMEQLSKALAAWDDWLSAEENTKPGMLARAAGAKWQGDLYNTWLVYLTNAQWRQAGEGIARLVERHPLSTAMMITLADMMRSRLLLTDEQAELLRSMLREAFRQEELAALMAETFGIRMADVSRARETDKQMADVVSWAEANGQVVTLLQALAAARPGEGRLLELLRLLNLDYASILTLTAATGQTALTEASPERLPRLTVTVGDHASETYELDGAVYTIGRVRGNDIIVRSNVVSRLVAKLVKIEGGYALEPIQGSANPLMLADTPVIGPHSLRDGDFLTIGGPGSEPGVRLTYQEAAFTTAPEIDTRGVPDGVGEDTPAALPLATLCTVEITGSKLYRMGDVGFLVAADLVMTTYSAVADVLEGQVSPGGLAFRFGRLGTGTGEVIAMGQAYGPAVGAEAQARIESERPWLVSADKELGYAIIRLAQPAGKEVPGGLKVGRQRGWLRLAGETRRERGESLRALTLAAGGAAHEQLLKDFQIAQINRATYLVLPPGKVALSAGAPILDTAGDVVGMLQGLWDDSSLFGAGREDASTVIMDVTGGGGSLASYVPGIARDLQEKGVALE